MHMLEVFLNVMGDSDWTSVLENMEIVTMIPSSCSSAIVATFP